MIPLANRPFIEYMLSRIHDQGITDVVLAVQYLAERFREVLGDGSQLGLNLQIIEESEPLGTAGAVKNVEHLLNDTTFVFNGDVVTDLNLSAMLEFHREKKSTATIALTPVDDPTQYGLVEMDRDQQIQRFLEKPRAEDITTNLINAGTYILEPDVLSYVPPHQHFMFERGLFPVLLQRRERLFGFGARAYWNDIGKPQNYLDVNHDILIGKAQYTMAGKEIASRVWLEDSASIHDSVQIVGPVVIGAGVSIARGARIIGPTVIGPRCQIDTDVSIEDSVLWEDNQIGEGSTLRSCVLGRGNIIGKSNFIAGGTIISDACVVGGENRLDRGIKLWPGTTLKDQAISF
jgi:mannose-1-phosphate guanylyltransferase